MTDWRKRAAEGAISAGTTLRFSRAFTAEEVRAFGELTRDYNPVHGEPRWCEQKGLDGPICHGLLVGSMLCEPGGQWGWLATGMSFRFRRPTYVGETVTCEMRVVEVSDEGRARAECVLTSERGEVVMTGELEGFLPVGAERALLARMLKEGDPGNPLSGEP